MKAMATLFLAMPLFAMTPTELHTLSNDYYDWRNRNYPVGASDQGLHTWDDQLADYGPWFDNHRRLRELVAELEELSLGIAEDDPRWTR